jgi:hypothetical protein
MTNDRPTIPLPQRLRTVSDMIDLGEKIAWGSETALMDEAADALDAAAQREAKLREALERTDSAMSWLIGLQSPSASHIERWVIDGRTLIAAYLENTSEYPDNAEQPSARRRTSP